MRIKVASLVAWVVALAGFFPSNLSAHDEPRREALPNIDRRGAQGGPPARPAAAAEEARATLIERVPGLFVDWDPVTGAPKHVQSPRGFLTGPDGDGGAVKSPATRAVAARDPLRAVKTFLTEHRGLFGHGPEALDRAPKKRDHSDAHNGLRSVIWQQEVDGIPVFEALLKAHVTARGELVNIGSAWMRDAETAADSGTPNRADLLANPRISAAEALALAGSSVADPLETREVAPSGEAAGATRRRAFTAPGLSDATAELVWLPMGADSLRLCWQTIFSSNERGQMFLALVDAETGEIQLRRSLTEDISNASYRVFTSDSPTPFSPGHPTPSTVQPPQVSRSLVTLEALNTTASPNGWIDDGVNETRGNNVDAHTDIDANNVADVPRPQGAPNRVFDFPLDLTQAPSTYQAAAVTQLFYWCNFMHDKLYELGFTEAFGNFQNNNFGRGGLGNDALQADAQDGSGVNNANFSTPPDGSPGRMQMFLWTGPTPDIDGDFDAEVVLHEYTHGLTNRLVGGGVGISANQSRGMGEGWSDFYGITLLAEPGDDIHGNWARGGYSRTLHNGSIVQNYYFGGRRYPYTTNITKNPLTFKDIDPTQASAHTGIPRNPNVGTTADQVHNMGEVWCVTLWEMRANLITKHGFAFGNQLALQLVTDGLKLSPANPNFLQARDAILQAELVLTGGANRSELWAAFAKRGMGASAFSPASSVTTGITESFDLPDDLSVSPTSIFAVSGEIGGPFLPGSRIYTLRNNGSAALDWTAAKTQSWLTLSGSSGTLAPGASVDVTAAIDSSAAFLSPGSSHDTITFRNVTSGATQQRAVSLNVTPPRVRYFSLDTDPGWTRTGQWAFGRPTGAGGGNGRPDPASGATGTNVLGVNLAGNYSTAVGGPYYVTTAAIDLTGYTRTQLQFRRWLNTDSQPYAFATIHVSNNGTTWTQLWSNAGISVADAAWTKVSYDISAIADNRSTVYIRWGYQIGSGAFAYSGWNIDDIEILGAPPEELTLTLPASGTEGDLLVNGTITASPPPVADLVVNLTSGNLGRVTVPSTVTLAANATTVSFPVTIVDDNVLNGSTSVAVSPSAPGRASRGASIVIHDNETAALTVALPASAVEGGGTVSGTVTASAAPANDIVVQLSSNKPGEALPPASVIIPAGQTSGSFVLAIIDDTAIDGPQSVTITASVPNWTIGTAAINVQDNETAKLILAVPSSVLEGETGKTGSVTISGTLAADLTVSLNSSNTPELNVPASVTIPAGQTSSSFPLTIVNDATTDGVQAVVLTASSSGFDDASSIISVQDDDVHHFAIGPIASPQVRGAAFAVSVTAQDINNATITSYSGTPALTGKGAVGTVAVTPSNIGSFVNGIWAGTVTVNTFSTGVVLTVDDQAGHAGSSNPFEVGTSTVERFTWTAIPSPQMMDNPIAATITALDSGNNVVSDFNGSADLKVLISVTNPAIGSGTDNWHMPLYGFVSKGRTQTLYLANELGGPARLTSIALYLQSASNQFFNSWTIRLKHTSQSSFTSASWEGVGWTVVHQSNLTPTTPGWFTFNFPTPFDYDGTSNLLVDFSFSNPTSGSSTPYTRCSTASSRTVYGTASSGDPLAWSGSSGGTPSIAGYVPNIQFSAEQSLKMRPGLVSFTNGVWAGDVSVPFSSPSVRLKTSDSLEHSGLSNHFSVVPNSGGAGSPGPTVFAENFESGTLGPAWSVTGTSAYRTVVTASNGPRDSHHLTMDSSSDGTDARNEATLTLNLAGRSDVILTFWAKMFNDEPNAPVTNPFNGGADFDGIAISADGITWHEIQSLRSPTITGAWGQFTVNLSTAIATRGLSFNSSFRIRFNQYDNFSITTDGIAIDDILVTAAPINVIAMTLPAQATEGAGALPCSLTLPAAQTTDLTVALSSNSQAKVTVPPSVTIPAGQISGAFSATVLDDTVLDGTKNVVITATAAGFNPNSASIQVLDNEIGTLALSLPSPVSEGVGGVQGQLTITPPPVGNFTFALSSSEVSAAQVPATVTFTPGQTNAVFPITVVNDFSIDGTQSTTITASAPGWTSASAILQVTDNENRNITISGNSAVYEGASATYSIAISGTLPTALVLSLSSSNPGVVLPASVTIPAGQTGTNFLVTATDDTMTNGTRSVTITASSPTFVDGTTTLSIYDNDVHHFSFSTISSPQKTGVPFPVTITAKDVNNVTIQTFAGTVSLSAAGDSGSATLGSTTSGSFAAGAWTGNLVCQTASTNVRVTASTGGATGTSNSFEVQSSPAISITPATIAVSLTPGATTTRSITISNTGGGTLTWSIPAGLSAAEIVSEGPVHQTNRPVPKSEPSTEKTPPADDASLLHSESREPEQDADSLATLSLATARTYLNANFNVVRAAIPNRYSFSDGITGTVIPDGGDDMYDYGNYLNTNLGTSLPYSDNVIAASALLGNGGQYFTRKYDGLWIFAADVNGLSYFEITGDLGADGAGSTDSAVLSVARDGVTYRGFVKRVYGAWDPSVNHLIIVADNGSVTHQTSLDTNNDYHRLTSLTGVTRIYSLLYAGTSGAYIDNAAALSIMTAFLDAISGPSWVSANPGTGGVAAGASQNVTLTLSAVGLTPGNYSRSLLISSNDPAMPQASVPLTLTVTDQPTLTVTPGTSFVATGFKGGPFAPASQAFTLTNSGSQALNWTAAKSAPWCDISPTGGTLASGASIVVTAALNAAADTLAAGSHTDTVTFTNTTNGIGSTTRDISLNIAASGVLTVTNLPLNASGPVGGPFTPESLTYTLSNTGDAPLNWAANKNVNWLTLSATSGIIPPGMSVPITVSLQAASLEPGSYEGAISFTNTASGPGSTTRSASLVISLPAPLLTPEPPITPGTSNTLTWNTVFGANSYEVQRSAEPTFASPVSSGDILGTSHSFTGLQDGSAYYYRTRARRMSSAQTGTWSQTDQAEFATGALANVSTSGYPGSVELAYSDGSGTQTITETFNDNGSVWSTTIFPDAPAGAFTRSVLTSGPNTTTPLPVNQGSDMTARGLGNSVHALRTNVTADRFANGSIEAWIAPENRANLHHAGLMLRANRTSGGVNGYAAVILFFADGTARADFTRVVNSGHFSLSNWFYSNTTSFNLPDHQNIRAQFSVSGSTLTLRLWRVEMSGDSVVETPIPFFNGTNTLTATDSTYPGEGVPGLLAYTLPGTAVLVDDVTITQPARQGYLPSGSMVSPLIQPANLQRWGTLNFAKNTPTAGSTLTVDVLDGNGAAIAINVPAGTDLNSLPAVTSRSAIRLRANFASNDPATTPRLEDWSIQYYTALDQTYYSAWSPVETSTQFNSPPTITAIADQSMIEDIATAPLAFAIDDDSTAAEAILLNVSSSNQAIVPNDGITLGGAGTNRTVRITPATDQHGSTTITIRALDGAGKFTDRVFSVVVAPRNDAPSFTRGADQIHNEDAGATIVSRWASAVTAGPADENTQALDFIVSSDSPALFVADPRITPDGTLSFTPAPHAHGTANVTVRLRDNGGVDNGGADVSAPQVFTIAIRPINDPPSFLKGPALVVSEDAGPRTIPAWATQISAGAPDETGQALTFLASTDNPTLFTAEPTLSSDGTLAFKPAPDAHGTATVTVRLRDNGGSQNGGSDTSSAQTFTITVTPVNDPPTLDPITDIELPEDSPAHTLSLAGISPGAENESDTLSFTVASSNPALITDAGVSYTPAAANGTLRFTPTANAVGSAIITVTVSDGNQENGTTSRTFTVRVAGTNDAPSFVKGVDQTVLEDSGVQDIPAWAKEIRTGPLDENEQGLSFIVSNNNPELFGVAPAISENGTLSFTPAPDAAGSAEVTVRLRDTGGIAGGGTDTSEVQIFTITVAPVNDAPAFAKGADQPILQSAGPQTIPGWATAISRGPVNESDQDVKFVISTDRPGLFATPPTISADGTLTFTPTIDANGSAIVTVLLQDNGGTASGGVDTSPPQTFIISSTAVNDAPSFVRGEDLETAQDAGPQAIPKWATQVVVGPADEIAQTLQFIVSVDDSTLFSAPPAIASDGTLTYSPAPDASGIATVTVVLQDDGGTEEGGVDTSAPQTFTIAITTYLEEEGTYNGLIAAAPGAPIDAGHSGLIRVRLDRKGAFSGKLLLDGKTTRFKGKVDRSGIAHFGSAGETTLTMPRRRETELLLSFKVDVANGTDTLAGSIRDNAGAFAVFTADRALFTGRPAPIPPQRIVPADLLGAYTVIFPTPRSGAQRPDESDYPKGNGSGVLSVRANGNVRIVGHLADGTAVSYANSLSKAHAWPLYHSSRKGTSISGMVQFREVQGVSDLDGSDLLWFCGSKAGAIYPDGWPHGIRTDLIGSRYERISGDAVLPNLSPSHAGGNAMFMCSDGRQGEAAFSEPLNIDSSNRVQMPALNSQGLVLRINPKTGLFGGKFVHPATDARAQIRGAFLQKQNLGSGAFRTKNATGVVNIVPRQTPAAQE
jgi:hypothetical protein